MGVLLFFYLPFIQRGRLLGWEMQEYFQFTLFIICLLLRLIKYYLLTKQDLAKRNNLLNDPIHQLRIHNKEQINVRLQMRAIPPRVRRVVLFINYVFQQIYKGMQRLLKLVQKMPNSFDYQRQNLGIFDIKTYQKAIDRISCSSSLEQAINNKNKRLSFIEYSNKNTNTSLYPTEKIILKQEIKPHQTRHIASRITQIIKAKKQASKFLSNQKKGHDQTYSSLGNEKKTSYSAYINARKKVFERQSSSVTNNSTPTPNSQKKQSFLKKPTPMSDDKKNEMFPTDYLNQELQIQLDGHKQNINNYMNNTTNKYQKIRLEGINKRIQIKRDKKQTIQISDLQKTSNLRKSFISVVKKKSTDSRLMINNKHKIVSQKKMDPMQQTKTSDYTKNFINQKNLQEQEIQIYPQISKIIKISKNNPNSFNIQEINSKSITILHHVDGNIKNIFSINEKEKLQIASITKIMTCYLVLTIAQKFCIDITKQKMIVSERASKMPGTSAKLSYSDVLTVYDMLHALMLPSGNDAAIALGQWGGKQIRRYSSLLRRTKIANASDQQNFIATLAMKRKSHLRLFIHHMNRLAKFMNLNSTHFVNTHGLMNEKAYSCSQNISLLTYYAMNNKMFRQIVGKQTYQCKIFNRTFSHNKEIIWDNTNKLLNIEGFLGVKTGITPSAGPCLSSLFQINKSQYFIITILKTKSCEMRFKQTINLLKSTLLHLIQDEAFNHLYRRAVEQLQKYDKLDLKQDDKEFLNTCREQSTQSNQSNQDRDDDDFNEMKLLG